MRRGWRCLWRWRSWSSAVARLRGCAIAGLQGSTNISLAEIGIRSPRIYGYRCSMMLRGARSEVIWAVMDLEMTKRFEWDQVKADHNARKHGVTFDEARTVFADGLAGIGPDPDHASENEERELIAGLSSPISSSAGILSRSGRRGQDHQRTPPDTLRTQTL